VSVLTAPLSALGLLALTYMLYILASLSQRLGAVIRMRPYYRGFYLSIALTLIAFVAHLMRSSVLLAPEEGPPLLNNTIFYLLAYYLPLTLAVTISLVVAWRYWGWLLQERDG